jgi:iron complex transport system permease protein
MNAPGRARIALWFGLVCFTLVLSVVLGGSLAPSRVLSVLTGGTSAAWERAVVFDLRIPRVCVAAICGAGLWVSGAALQGLFRNALADPSIVGATSGATLGAVLALYSHVAHAELVVPLASFAGALAGVGAALRLASLGGSPSTPSLLLSGVAVSGVLGALSSMVLSVSVAQWELGRQMLSWMLGGLEGRSWTHVALAGPPVLIGSALTFVFARELDALALSEESAEALGVDLVRTRRAVIALVSLVTGATVAVMGGVSFVGLVAPHLVRRTVGPAHRVVLPVSALTGAFLVVAADVLTRMMGEHYDVRPGSITALLGAPFFAWLLMRQRRREAAS